MLTDIMMHQKPHAVNHEKLQHLCQNVISIAAGKCMQKEEKGELCNLSIFWRKNLVDLDIALLAFSSDSQYS